MQIGRSVGATDVLNANGEPAHAFGRVFVSWLAAAVNLVVQVVFASQDYVVGLYLPPRRTVTVSGVSLLWRWRLPHASSRAGLGLQYYYLYFNMCARLSTLIDNRDLCATMTAKMDPTQCCSPKTTGLPREYFEVNKPVYYYVPGQSPQLNPITYRTATTSESSLSYPQPRQASVAFSLNPTTGQITWTPNTVGLYAYQVRVLDTYSEVPLDFLMEGALAHCSAAHAVGSLSLRLLQCWPLATATRTATALRRSFRPLRQRLPFSIAVCRRLSCFNRPTPTRATRPRVRCFVLLLVSTRLMLFLLLVCARSQSNRACCLTVPRSR